MTNNITIFINNTFSNQVDNVFDVQKQIKNAEARNPRLPVFPSGDIDKIIAMLEATKIKSFSNANVFALKNSPWAISMLSVIIIVTCLVVIFCFVNGWIRCPLLRILTRSKSQILNMQQPHSEQDINLHEYYQYLLRHKQQEISNTEP